VAKEFLDLHSPALTQRLAAAFLAGPHLERHLAVLRAELRQRRDQLVASLHEHCPGLRYRIPSGGYYLWARLPAPLTTAELLPEAGKHGVAIRPGPQFTPGGGGEDHVRLCFAALPPRAIAEGVERLGAALADAGRRADARRPGARRPPSPSSEPGRRRRGREGLGRRFAYLTSSKPPPRTRSITTPSSWAPKWSAGP
jgi:2-aminoadipate transaminase